MIILGIYERNIGGNFLLGLFAACGFLIQINASLRLFVGRVLISFYRFAVILFILNLQKAIAPAG